MEVDPTAQQPKPDGLEMLAQALENLRQQSEAQQRHNAEQSERHQRHPTEKIQALGDGQREDRETQRLREAAPTPAVSLPIFNGSGRAPASRFLTMMAQHFDCYQVPESRQVQTASGQLRDKASESWVSYRATNFSADDGKPLPTWEQFEDLMAELYPDEEAYRPWSTIGMVRNTGAGGG